MIKAHKIRLQPNNRQSTYFAKACGVARFAYNWGLARWIAKHEAGEKVSEAELRKELNAIKREQFPWMMEVTKCAPQLAIKENLNNAFKNFYRRCKNNDKQKGFPKFHKKGVNDSFAISNDQFQIDGKYVKIPNLGIVKLAEKLRFDGKILGAVVSRKADQWYIAVQVEMSDQIVPTSENQAVGVDLGVTNLATLSDGAVISGVQVTKKFAKKIKRLNQSLSRKKGFKKGELRSNNFWKAKTKLAKLYLRMANVRDDQLHKLTHSLTRNFGVIGIEDLNVEGMMANHRLAGAVADRSFFEFRRQLEYKAKDTGSVVVVADMFFASSKTCNVCGIKNSNLALADRKWLCSSCGTHHDRDVNAAINLKNNAVSSTVSACGELAEVRHSSKQELNSRFNQK